MRQNINQFAQAPSANIQRSTFDRSHTWKGTIDAGFLVPFFVDEALPGDTFNLKTQAFARMATPIFPIFDNLYAETLLRGSDSDYLGQLRALHGRAG